MSPAALLAWRKRHDAKYALRDTAWRRTNRVIGGRAPVFVHLSPSFHLVFASLSPYPCLTLLLFLRLSPLATVRPTLAELLFPIACLMMCCRTVRKIAVKAIEQVSVAQRHTLSPANENDSQRTESAVLAEQMTRLLVERACKRWRHRAQ